MSEDIKLTPEMERAILDCVYWGDVKLMDLADAGRVFAVGFCKECDNCTQPLPAVVNGEVKYPCPPSCRYMGWVKPDGWCYRFRRDGKAVFTDEEEKQNG